MDIDEIKRATKRFMPEPWLYEVLRVLSEHDEVLTELAELRAYKEASEKQEPVPVAWRRYCGIVAGSPCFAYREKEPPADDGFTWKKLCYAKPVPADQPAESVDRQSLIEILTSTSGQSEGVAADAILEMVRPKVANAWESSLIEAAHAVVRANQGNTGSEPSVSLLACRIDELREILDDADIPKPEQQRCAECWPVDAGTALYCVKCWDCAHKPAVAVPVFDAILVAEILEDYAGLQISGYIPSAGRYSPSDAMEQAELIAAAPSHSQQSCRITEQYARETITKVIAMWDDIYPDMESGKYPQERLEHAEFTEMDQLRQLLAKLNAENADSSGVQQIDPSLLTWLPSLLNHYEKQARLNGFTPDTSLQMVRAAIADRCPSHESDQGGGQ